MVNPVCEICKRPYRGVVDDSYVIHESCLRRERKRIEDNFSRGYIQDDDGEFVRKDSQEGMHEIERQRLISESFHESGKHPIDQQFRTVGESAMEITTLNISGQEYSSILVINDMYQSDDFEVYLVKTETVLENNLEHRFRLSNLTNEGKRLIENILNDNETYRLRTIELDTR